MATINDIGLKNVKTFRGVEYPVCYQGTIYYKGKRVGYWSQDSWGGPDIFDVSKEIMDALNEEAKKYYGKDSIYDIDCLMDEILHLTDDEKQYKAFVKKGFNATVLMTDGYHAKYIAYKNLPADNTMASKVLDPKVTKFKEEEAFRNKDITVRIYRTLDDFAQYYAK